MIMYPSNLYRPALALALLAWNVFLIPPLPLRVVSNCVPGVDAPRVFFFWFSFNGNVNSPRLSLLFSFFSSAVLQPAQATQLWLPFSVEAS